MKLIVGLGNLGMQYDKTRHNIGFMVLDRYLDDVNWKEKDNGLYYKTNFKGEDVIFLKPTTFMNLSGDCIIKYVNYFKIKIEDILVIHDDLDMLVGSFKLKKNTSSGGHNGIKSIEKVLHTQEFARLKIGINNEHKKEVIDFVLGKFSKEDINEIFKNDYNKVIELFISKGYNETISKYKS